jgi:hypothetical protein
MSRVQHLYGIGWLAMTTVILTMPPFGVLATLAVVVPLIAMPVPARNAIICSREQWDRSVGATEARPQNDQLMFGPGERATAAMAPMNPSPTAWWPVAGILLRAEYDGVRATCQLGSQA